MGEGNKLASAEPFCYCVLAPLLQPFRKRFYETETTAPSAGARNTTRTGAELCDQIKYV